MIIETTVRKMLRDSVSTGMITEAKRSRIDATLGHSTSTPAYKMRVFQRHTRYHVYFDTRTLKEKGWNTDITISDEWSTPVKRFIPMKQGQCNSIW